MEGEELVLPRGCTEVALAMLREEGAEPLVTDKRVRGKHIYVTFAGELRDSQKPCRDNLVEHDTGVLVAPTGFGKTVIGASIVATRQVSTLIIVGRVTLAEQWHDSLMKFLEIDEAPPVLLTPTGRKKRHQPDVVGVIGGGKRLASGIVDVAIIDSLLVKGEIEGEIIVDPIVHNYGMVIVDEAHHVGSGQYDQVLSAVSSRYVYGMTATPKRSDGHDRAIFLGCGPKRYEVNVKEQIAEQGLRRLLVPRFTTSHPDEVTTKSWVQLVDYICSDENRKFLIVSDAIRALEYGRTVLVLARRVEHARALHKAIKEWGSTLDVQFALLVGKDGSAERKRRLEALRHVSEDRSLCVVATGGLVGEGFDLDRLDCLLLAEPVSFSERLAQWVGRLHRTREGKSDVIVMDYIDPSIPMFDNHWRSRLREYKKLGYEMAKGADLLLVGLKDESHEGGHLVSNSEFSGVFEADLRECSKTVLISSTWVKISRVRWLKDALRDAVNRGVAVSIIIKQPSAQDTEWHAVLDILKDAGCSVEVRTDGTVLDYAVFDGTLVWYGTISALAFTRKEDCALRFASREVAATLLKAQETGTVVSL
jgi:superfamily II DNA or RNA helicase